MKALREWTISEASQYLESQGLSWKVTELVKAGAGNMNCTLRARGDKNSIILKQSSEFCENFPQVAAPIERLKEELSLIHISEPTRPY